MRIVALGGGTGLPVMLGGLRTFARSGAKAAERISLDHVTAIVSVSDDGGSSGRLMIEFDTLPPGDVRNCLLALADDHEAPLLKSFLGYRFGAADSGALEGHSVGNLLLTALTRLNGNDFLRAISDVARILNLQGRILLPTLERHTLVAVLQDGSEVRGESRIQLRANPSPVERVRLERVDSSGAPAPFIAQIEAVRAIEAADLLLLGPGSLFTSVIPSFLVDAVRDALVVRSQQVPCIYVCNLMTEAGETDRFGVAEHVAALLRHAPGLRLSACVANRQPIEHDVLRRYALARMSRGCQAVGEALSTVATQAVDEPDVELEGLAERVETQATRLRILADEMRQVLDESIQVRPRESDEPLPCGALLAVDAARVVEIDDRGQRKRVLRHDAQAILQAVFTHIFP